MAAWGPQDWWPAYTRFEVIVGAFLTQNTAWTNVERALDGLRAEGALNLEGIRRTPLPKLARVVRSSGYFRQKAKRLKNFVSYLDARYSGSLERMFAQPTDKVREELLAVDGVGPETADSILLYAGGHPVFVVDAYTRRIFERHGLINPKAKYEEIRRLMEQAFGQGDEVTPASRRPDARANGVPGAPAVGALGCSGRPRDSRQDGGTTFPAEWDQPPKSPLAGRRRHKFVIQRAPVAARAFDEFHALLVQAAKHHCLKAEARCSGCPLERFLEKQP